MGKIFSFKSIYVKFVVIFVGIIWFSSSIAFMLGISYFRDSFTTQIEAGLFAKAEHILEFDRQYHPNLLELQKLIDDNSAKITLYNDLEEFTLLTAAEKTAIQEGEIVVIPHVRKKLQLPGVAFQLQDAYVLLSTSTNRDILLFFKNIIGMVLALCALLGSILVVIASRMIVKPIKQLTKATQEVAKGNFDTKLHVLSRDELGQLSANFNKMTEELQNIEYLRKDFISSVSHEFKTPMTAIQGFAKLLKEKDLTEEQAEDYKNIIIDETGRLANLSNNLLRLSNLESQAIYAQAQPFSLDEQIRNVILLLEPKWSAKNIELELELQPIRYMGDEELLKQVWINLIENAIKFSEQNGRIQISTEKSGAAVITTISDTGIGIPEKDRSKIFERFYKADKSRSKEGNGLGLPIVKKIIELHHGEIDFHSQLGAGTTFIIKL